MDKLILDTLKALNVEASEENRETLRKMFNQSRADDFVYDVRLFQADDHRTRLMGIGSQGESVTLLADTLPNEGDLISYANKQYYVSSFHSSASEIRAALGTKPTDRAGRPRS